MSARTTAIATPTPYFWQDLVRDWRRWSAVERIAAGSLVMALAAVPVASLAAFLHLPA